MSDENLYIGAGEYLYHCLTGVWRQDPGHAIQAGSYNATTRSLDGRGLETVGVSLAMIAPLRSGHEISPLSDRAARRLGLPSGLPVAGPYHDQEAGYLAAACVSDRPLQCSLGTAWVGNFVVSDEAKLAGGAAGLVIPSPASHGRLVVRALRMGNLTWEWALQTFVSRNVQSALDRQNAIFDKALLPPPGLLATPWLTCRNPFDAEAVGAGGMFGVRPETSLDDLLRAVAAGMAFEMTRIFERARDGALFDAVVITGGASRSLHFRRLLAVLFEPAPVFGPAGEELAVARGALYGLSRRAARPRVIREKRKDDPAAIQQAYELYVRLCERLGADRMAGLPFRLD
jgi:sugar (pentulose or hexulose) kinase